MNLHALDILGIWFFIFVLFHLCAVLLIGGWREKKKQKRKFEPLFFVVSRGCDFTPAGPYNRKEANKKADELNAAKKTQKFFITQCPTAYEPGKVFF